MKCNVFSISGILQSLRLMSAIRKENWKLDRDAVDAASEVGVHGAETVGIREDHLAPDLILRCNQVSQSFADSGDSHKCARILER